jgi:hypothetical protein
MRKLIGASSLCVALAGCFGGSDPEVVPVPAGPTRAQCDSYAAQAIQSADLAAATALAAQASQCYADMQRP